MQLTASMYCSRKRESPSASLNGRPRRTSVNHDGRGQEPVTVVGRVRSRVALSIRGSSRPLGYTNSVPAHGPKAVPAGFLGGPPSPHPHMDVESPASIESWIIPENGPVPSC